MANLKDAIINGSCRIIGDLYCSSQISGAIGTAADKLIITTSGGQLTSGSTLAASSLSSGATPTVSLSNGTITFGIPAGPAGPQGPSGSAGATGPQGVSVSKVEQTTTSTADAGTNVITVTLSNGNTSTFNVKNGSKGSTGPTGPEGPNFDLAAGSGDQYLIGASSQSGNINTAKTSGAYYNGSNLYAEGFYVSSLRSLKENIESTKVNATELINSQEIVDFNYKDDEHKSHKVGLIADDSDPLFLDYEHKTVDLYNTCGILMKAVQELSAEVMELKAKLNELTLK